MRKLVHFVAGVGVLVGLFAVGTLEVLDAEEAGTKTITTSRGELVRVPAEVPDRGGFWPARFIETDEGMTIELYHNPDTPRPVDYAEVYDARGNLLAIAWMDEFGLPRVIVDRSLLAAGASGLAGVLVSSLSTDDSI